MSLMIEPIHSGSFGKSPFFMSLPNKLQINLLKYSCLGKERKLLESVSIPIKQLISPILDKIFEELSKALPVTEIEFNRILKEKGK